MFFSFGSEFLGLGCFGCLGLFGPRWGCLELLVVFCGLLAVSGYLGFSGSSGLLGSPCLQGCVGLSGAA